MIYGKPRLRWSKRRVWVANPPHNVLPGLSPDAARVYYTALHNAANIARQMNLINGLVRV